MKIKWPKLSPVKWLRKKLPVLDWMPKYKSSDVLPDIVAGLTVGLTLIPQSIAYAHLAGMEPQHGLYSGFAGCFVYIFFGTVKQVSIGPTAVISLLTYQYTHSGNPDFPPLLCFLSGIVELLSGLFRLGCLVDFVSIPVTAGFTSAAALVIMTSQVKGLLGLSFHAEGFISPWTKIFKSLDQLRPWDMILGFTCIAALLAMRKLPSLKMKERMADKLHLVINHTLWLLSISRNAIVVILCAILAYILTIYNFQPFNLTGSVRSGFPKLDWPPFSTAEGNVTHDFIKMTSYLGSGIIILPLVSLLNNVAIAKAFAMDDIFDADQEMIALGLCNIFASLFGSMPISGSFSRSAVNEASGVRTPLSGLYTALLVILALAFVVPYFYYIPRATLSSMIICAVIFMIEFHMIAQIWKACKRDLIPAFGTFFACLALGMETGILIGVGLDLFYLLYLSARPSCTSQIVMLQDSPGYVLFRPKSGITFSNANYLRLKLNQICSETDLPLIIDCGHLSTLDYTGIQAVKSLINIMIQKSRKIIFYRLDDNLAALLAKVIGPTFIHEADSLDQINKELLESPRQQDEPEPTTDIEIQDLSHKEPKTQTET